MHLSMSNRQGGGGGKAGHRVGFWHFSNIAVKFPTPGQKCEVKYNCCHGNGIKGVFVFLLWCTFMVPSFKNIALIFPEISFILYFTIFRCKQNDVITDLICIIEKRQYL